MEEKSTSSSRSTVSNCEKGELILSRTAFSGVKLIFALPSMTILSLVLTSMLSRALTSASLNVPRPFTLTILSLSRLSLTTPKMEVTNSSASVRLRL